MFFLITRTEKGTEVMIDEINPTTILPDTEIKAAESADIFSQGFEVFQSLLSSITSIDKNQTTTSAQTSSELAQDSSVADLVLEVSRNVFSQQPLLTTLESTFSSVDVSALQNSLANALTSSLMSSLSNTNGISEKGVSENTASNTVIEESSWSLAESLGELSFGKYAIGLEETLSAISPADNIPIISDIQQITGSSQVKAFSSMVGGYFVGGPIGLAYAAANLASEEFTGDSILGNIVDLGRDVFNGIPEDFPVFGSGLKTEMSTQKPSDKSPQ
jgi:hypothetical protein